jgi:hypothetical protein
MEEEEKKKKKEERRERVGERKRAEFCSLVKGEEEKRK